MMTATQYQTLGYRSLARAANSEITPTERAACYRWAVAAAVAHARTVYGVNSDACSEFARRELGGSMIKPELSAILAGAFVR